jgi:predicted chitinase
MLLPPIPSFPVQRQKRENHQEEMMQIEIRLLTGLGVSENRAARFLPDLNDMLPRYEMDTLLRTSHFLAQVLHESALMKSVEENLNYSAESLLKVFPGYFNESRARTCARNPEKIANRAYGGRMGNGDEASGDGYRYRGRGLIQLTGKNNYRAFSQWIGEDVVSRPDVVAEKYAVHSAVYYWISNRINALADADDVRAVTKAINGGDHGLEDRIRLLDRARSLLGSMSVPAIEGATHRITAATLNLRRTPEVNSTNKLGNIPQGTPVVKMRDADIAGWCKIQVMLGGRVIEGFVASSYLGPL